MRITKIGIQNFRGIGKDPVYLDWTKKVNVLIGVNNSGKSSVVAAIERAINNKFRFPDLDEIDQHRREGPSRVTITVDINWKDGAPKNLSSDSGRFILETPGKDGISTHPFQSMSASELEPFMVWMLNSTWPSNMIHSNALEAKRTECAITMLQKSIATLPRVLAVPAYRQIVDGEPTFAGSGLVKQLGKWQNPVIGRDSDRRRFDAIQGLLRHLLDIPDVTIDIPRDTLGIIVNNGGLRLPIENYGTGVHQVIILAVAILDVENALVTIEEPESYLHPRLQRDLLRFLIDKTSNRYLLTTHSPGFLSRPNDCDIIRVKTDGKATTCSSVSTSRETLEVLRDLGISAADILQARFVIWVEGPSDAIYLRKWIEVAQADTKDEEKIVEGIDYAMMFYGGKCLPHITFDSISSSDAAMASEDASRLLELLRISQNSAVILDSDKSADGDSLWVEKKRIEAECTNTGMMCWITAGREIENYLAPKSIMLAYKDSGLTLENLGSDPWAKIDDVIEKAAGTSMKSKWKYSRAKPRWAHQIVSFVDDLNILDLKSQIGDLLRRIHQTK